MKPPRLPLRGPGLPDSLMAVVTIGIALCLAGCGGDTTPSGPPRELAPVALTADWPSGSPESQQLDIAMLHDLVTRIDRREYGSSITSLLIARRDQLVVEEYFNGWTMDRPHTMQSVTKSVTSLLAGLAVDRGRLAVTDRAVDLFPDYAPVSNLDDHKRALTVRDLLTMRTGLDWSESSYPGSPLERLNTCQCDWLRFVLDWPMREPAGSRWEYNSGGTILLGGIVGRAVGQRIDVFAAAELFGPLGAQGANWFAGLPDGLPHTGGGLNLRPRDAAKIGQIVLGDGRWRGRQIASASWIRESTEPLLFAVRALGGRLADYGYLWWRLPGGVITASGARGQWIFIVPDKQLVVVSTAGSDADFSSAPTFLYSHVIPAAR